MEKQKTTPKSSGNNSLPLSQRNKIKQSVASLPITTGQYYYY